MSDPVESFITEFNRSVESLSLCPVSSALMRSMIEDEGDRLKVTVGFGPVPSGGVYLNLHKAAIECMRLNSGEVMILARYVRSACLAVIHNDSRAYWLASQN